MNPFDVLGVPESAALDAALLKDRYHELSRRHHPDVAGDSGNAENGDRFATINRAYQLLQSPATRLRELLRLHGKEDLAAKGSVPPGLLDLFMKIGPVLQEADDVIDERQRAGSALAQALLAPKVMAIQDRLAEAMQELRESLETALAELPEVDSLLSDPEPEAASFDAAGSLCRQLLYLEKWQSQSQTRWHQLAV